MISLLFLLFSWIACPINATNFTNSSCRFELSITRQINNKSYPVEPGLVYTFNDNEKTTMNCILNCSGTCDGRYKYSLYFYLHEKYAVGEAVSVAAKTEGIVTRTFTLYKNDTGIICKALKHNDMPSPHSHPLYSKVKLQYVPRTPVGVASGREVKPSPPSPILSSSFFGDEPFALLKCTAQKEGLALLSWQQMKGSDRVLLKTVLPTNYTTDVIHDTLNKTLEDSDWDTLVFCAARYILNGTSLSNRMQSNGVRLTFNRTIETLPEDSPVLSFSEWIAIIGAIIAAALITVVILVTVMLKYRSEVKRYERDEQMRNRPALVAPISEDIYDQVYGHGAGLKRPKVRPTGREKRP